MRTIPLQTPIDKLPTTLQTPSFPIPDLTLTILIVTLSTNLSAHPTLHFTPNPSYPRGVTTPQKVGSPVVWVAYQLSAKLSTCSAIVQYNI